MWQSTFGSKKLCEAKAFQIAQTEDQQYFTGQNLLPEERIILADELEHVAAAIDLLPERERVALYQRVVLGKTYAEIAKELQIAQDHARKILERARAHIREMVYGGKGI